MTRRTIKMEFTGPVVLEADLADLTDEVASLENVRITSANATLDADMILGSVHSAQVTVTIGIQPEDFIGFPLFIDMADMPLDFWQEVRQDGGDLRAELPDGTELPLDIVAFDHFGQTGSIFIRVDLSATNSTEVILRYGASALCATSKDAPTGRYAVWQDFESVVSFGESNEDRTRSRFFRAAGDPNNFVATPLHTTVNDPHQGVAWDGEFWYLFDTNSIRKYTADFSTVVAENLDPVGDASASTGLNNLDHCGDGTVVGDHVVLSISEFSGVGIDGHLCRFLRSDLSFHSAVDISATVGSCASVCHDPEIGVVYGCEWPTMDRVYRFDAETLTAMSPILLSEFILKAQGIELYRGALWINSDEFDETYRVELDGIVQASGLFGQSVAGNYEGMCVRDGSLVTLSDPTSGASFLTEWVPLDEPLHGGAAVHFPSDASIELAGIAGLTNFVLGCSFFQDNTAQKTIVSYRDESAGATDDRVSLAIDDGNKASVWDNVNSWLHGPDPGVGIPHRLVTSYQGAERSLYVNGALISTEIITAAPGDWDMLTIGMNDDSGGSRHRGTVGFVYLYPGARSAAWLQAEYDNLDSPLSFYSIT